MNKSKKTTTTNSPQHHFHSRTLFQLKKQKYGPALVVLPKNICSSILLQDEKLLMVLHQHLITLLPYFILSFLAALAPFILSSLPIWKLFSPDIILITLCLWYFFIFEFLFIKFIIWYFNIYLITDERIIDINFTSILYSDISITKIENIEDTTAKTIGFWGIIFNYGHVFIQTAAEKSEFGFYKIPNPEIVNKILSELILEEEEEKLQGRSH